VAKDQFCGKCGASRAGNIDPSSMQSKLASAWQAQHAARATAAVAPPNGTLPLAKMRPPTSLHEDLDDLRMAASAEEAEQEEQEESVEALRAALVKQPQDEVVWGSAAKAREFLESLSATRTPSALARFWRSRRGDFYLALALVLVVIVIRWGIWSDHSVGATGRGAAAGSAIRGKRAAPDADLSAFDQLLIGLGLAEAPDDAPQYKGNPNAQVWVDLNTALYYCVGSDLYGKTPKGKISSQRDAQLDQFEPSNRKVCD
jgi:hypothetical protein